jgi:hypothetical protein
MNIYKEETDVLDEMIEDANARTEMYPALEGDIVKKDEKAEFEETLEDQFILKLIVDIQNKKDELTNLMNKFTKIVGKGKKKKRKRRIMRREIKNELYETYCICHDVALFMKHWTKEKKLKFKKIADESLLYDLDPIMYLIINNIYLILFILIFFNYVLMNLLNFYYFYVMVFYVSCFKNALS